MGGDPSLYNEKERKLEQQEGEVRGGNE